MTTRTLVFDSPFLLGFEHIRTVIERVAKADAETYPRYNVEQLDDDRLRISLAVAGFAQGQLQVTVEANQLIIAGRREDASETPPGAYLHRGIAARGFQRAFVLAEGMEVEAAALEYGVLHIDLVRPEPARLVRTIPIRIAG
jgi:HSP20 family molecular chaperone IbpA